MGSRIRSRMALVAATGALLLAPGAAADTTLDPRSVDADALRWRDIEGELYEPSFRSSFSYSASGSTSIGWSNGGEAFTGTVTATAQKPNFAHQIKLVGRASITSATEAPDPASNPEGWASWQLGRSGRWWDEDAQWNLSDSQLASALAAGHSVVGYLLMDFFITDRYGNATKPFSLDSTYHVLWSDLPGQRARTSTDSAWVYHDIWRGLWGYGNDITVAGSTVGVYAEGEPNRPAPGAVSMPWGVYPITVNITEESFHDNMGYPTITTQYGGFWAQVLEGNLTFVLGAPSLAWAGTGGYAGDGVKPNSGPPGAEFTFKVMYRDPTGDGPLKSRCLLYRRVGKSWELRSNLALTRSSGDVSTGAIYAASTSLPNRVWKHRFYFEAGDGTPVVGDPPSRNMQGPLITESAPRLYWTGQDRYTRDGVDPNSGAAGATLVFKVMYQDSDGQAPETSEVIIERNGFLYKTRAMTTGSAGGYRLGKTFRRPVRIAEPGTYRYRFNFAQGGRTATGAPANWRSGPNITESGAFFVSGLAATPTNAGARVSFTLSSLAGVTATILNIAGRPVKTLCSGRECEAGANTLLWSAMSDDGLRVPYGVYLVDVAAKTEDGSQTRGLTQVRLGR